MSSLNLLSPQAKKSLRLRYLFLSLENILGTLLIFVMIISAIMIPTANLLKKIQQDLAKRRAEVAAHFSNYENQAQTITDQINVVNKIRAKNLPPSLVIKTIRLAQNTGIAISAVSWQANGYVQINGLASNRHDLVTFQNSLKRSQKLKEVNIPLSEFLPKENIQFSIVSQFVL